MLEILNKFVSYLEWMTMDGKDEGTRVSIVLTNIDKTSLNSRKRNKWDDKFKDLVSVLHNYSSALNFLNQNGNVCDAYFEELEKYEPEKNLLLQRCFCRVSRNKYTDKMICKYPNLLFQYLKRWDLSVETKRVLKQAPAYYSDVIDLYNMLAPEFCRERI